MKNITIDRIFEMLDEEFIKDNIFCTEAGITKQNEILNLMRHNNTDEETENLVRIGDLVTTERIQAFKVGIKTVFSLIAEIINL